MRHRHIHSSWPQCPGSEGYLASKAINVAASTLSGTRIDMENRSLSDLVRASVHYYNTEDEIARFCAAVSSIDKAIAQA